MPAVNTPVIDKNGVHTSRYKNSGGSTTSSRIAGVKPTPPLAALRSPSEAPEFADDLMERYKSLRLTLKGDVNKSSVSIGYIAVPLAERGLGIGSEVLREIVDEADRNGWTVTVTPAQLSQSKELLLVWYGRYGFIADPEWTVDNHDHDEMTRVPA